MDSGTRKPPRPIGEALREWRLSRGLNQTQVGDAAGMTQTNVSKIEAGGAMYVDDITRVEDHFAVPRGTILRLSGHVEDGRTVEDCIAADPSLSPQNRATLMDVLRGMRAIQQRAERS